ncbi:MAG: hypothetical protein NWE83_05700 [Candidatus Bathyarchaeota archaeon]|nr:hypothetical protein [Candidatus Bathyarchaeota archaeon]
MLQELLSPWISYISAFIIIIIGTILNGLVSIKSRDQQWLTKVQNNPKPILLFLIIEAVMIYIGSIVLQPILDVWLMQYSHWIPLIITEILVSFYLWFDLSFGCRINKPLIIITQLVAAGITIFFMADILYTIYFVIGACIVALIYFLFLG